MFEVLKKISKITPFGTAYVFLYHIVSGVLVALKLNFTMNIIESGYKYIIDSGDINSVIRYGIYLLALIFIERVMEYFYAVFMNGFLYEKSDNKFKYEVAHKLTEIEMIKFEDREFLSNLERASNAVDDERMSTCVHLMARISGEVVEVVLILLTLLSYSKYLVYLALLTVVPYFVTRIIRGKAFYKLKNIEIYDERKLNYLYSIFTDAKINREIKLNDSSDFFVNRYENIFSDVGDKYYNERLKDAKSLLFCDILSVISYSVAIIITIKLAFSREIAIGMMGAALIAFRNMQSSTKEMITSIGNMPKNLMFANDFINFMNTEEEKRTFDVEFGNVKMEDVSFTYPNSENGIKNINAEIKEGESVAIVGYNGSGKTTFTKVISGIYKSDGKIVVGNSNMNFSGISFDDYTIVPQIRTETNLTVGEHISSKENFDSEKVYEKLRFVGLSKLCDEEILNTRIGKEFDGIELSGGERERLDIARALYEDKKLIIMDEPTSALDPMEESAILKKFIEISKNITSIIVTHRLGITKFVDKVIVFKDGEIIASGTHEDLMEKCEHYRNMYNEQSRFYV